MATAQDVATLFLQDIGAPVTAGNLHAVEVWQAGETITPTQNNNPWNLHSWGGLPGQTGYVNYNSKDQNVAVFNTIEAGVLANARNLLNLSGGSNPYGYAQIVTAFRANDPAGALQALGNSSWAGSHYQYSYKDHTTGKWISIPGTNTVLATFLGLPESHVFQGTQGGSGSGGDTVTPVSTTVTADQWNAIIACFTSKHPQPTHPLPGYTGNFELDQAPDLIACAASNGLDLSHFNFAPFVGKSLSDIRDALAATGTIPPASLIPDVLGSVEGALMFVGIIIIGVVFIGTGGLIALRKNS